MQCPKCKMNNRDENKVCMYCGFEFGNTLINQSIQNPNRVVPTNTVNQSTSPGVGVNNNSVVQRTPNNQIIKSVEEVSPNRSRILITLPAFGILVVYFYIIVTLSLAAYTVIKISHLYHLDFMDIVKSKEFLKCIGIDLLLSVSFILTILHKKFMGFIAILYSIAYLIYKVVLSFDVYKTLKFSLIKIPLIVGIFVSICAIFYLREEKPI